MFVSAKSSLAMTSEVFNATGVKQVSIFGMKGSIGGKQVDFTGQVFQGNEGPAPFTSGAAFYGSFHGQATEAKHTQVAYIEELWNEFKDERSGQRQPRPLPSITAICLACSKRWTAPSWLSIG